MRVAAVTLALAALLAGCGGSSHRAATTTTARRPSPGMLLQRYFDAMGKHERRFDTLSERVVETINALDLIRPSKDWPAAARRLGPVTTGFDRLGVDISKVKPPSPLLDVHVKLAEATVSFAEYVFNLQQALAAQLPAQLALAAEADTLSIRVARREWAKAVTLYAAKVGVTPPVWLVPSPAG
ncbi:MAG TPA: hypothetical protein VIU16_08450 [Gaiellaceae bacterium]